MNKTNLKLFLFFIIGLLSAFLVMYLIENYRIEKKQPATEIANSTNENFPTSENLPSEKISPKENVATKNSIDVLTNEKLVIDFVKSNKKLPEYYLTKAEARKRGWVASEGNLCEVLPGKAIGGDKFSNREKTLPAGAQYFEADVNYNCGRRNADRIVFTKNGEVYLTKNHYKTFEKQ